VQPSRRIGLQTPGIFTRSRHFVWKAAVAVALLASVAAFSLSGTGDDASSISIERTAAYQDPALLARAWHLPVARLYKAGPFEYQRNQSFCGPTSAANLLRSIGRQETPGQVVLGSGVITIFGFLPFGLTLDEEAALVRKSAGAKVEVLRNLSLAAFRSELLRTNNPSMRYIINFSRSPLFGRGHGHHSPILGYLADSDLVFVGDVNRDFRPWLVRSDRLYKAMNTIDSASGLKRGLIIAHLHPN
jgi:hypothetical protein